LRSIIEGLPPEAVFEVARRRLEAFQHVCGERAPDSDWVRSFTENASAWFHGAQAPVEPTDFGAEEERHGFPGASSYISGLEELWFAIKSRLDHKESRRWSTQALYSCVSAELEHFWAEAHPEDWEKTQKVLAGEPGIAAPTQVGHGELEVLAMSYLARRGDPRFQEQHSRIWLEVADGLLPSTQEEAEPR
jgi:hypothetical protein